MIKKLSRPVINKIVKLQTAPAQRMQHWMIDRLDGIFYMLNTVFRQNENVSQLSEETAIQIATQLTGLEQQIKQWLTERSDPDENIDGISYSSPKSVTIQCSTPQMLCCVEVLVQYDQLVQCCDKLWLSQEISREESFKITREWTLKISRVIKECSDLYHALKQRAQDARG